MGGMHPTGMHSCTRWCSYPCIFANNGELPIKHCAISFLPVFPCNCFEWCSISLESTGSHVVDGCLMLIPDWSKRYLFLMTRFLPQANTNLDEFRLLDSLAYLNKTKAWGEKTGGESRDTTEAVFPVVVFTFSCEPSIYPFYLNKMTMYRSICQFSVSDLKHRRHNGVFPKWKRNSVNSDNLINHCSMNWSPFKDTVSHMCLADTVVASWHLTQEWAGLNLKM